MGNYENFRKIETNGNLLISCQPTRCTSNTSSAKMAPYERDRICCQKSIFQLTRLFKQLSSCSNNAHFQVVGAFK